MILNTTVLKHPNVMSEAERMALPDPCRPLDSPVIPAKRSLPQIIGVGSDEPLPYSFSSLSDSQARHHTDTPSMVSFDKSFNLDQFIQDQQNQAHDNSRQFVLPLSWLPKMVKSADKAWWERVMTQHSANKTNALSQHNKTSPVTTLQQLEKRLYVMGHMYHTMLCVFLLCQCKSRKTLNPHITLLDLTKAINAYVKAHHTELEFLTHQNELIIEPEHVEMAIAAMGWQMSKHEQIAHRFTNISSHNPLTNL